MPTPMEALITSLTSIFGFATTSISTVLGLFTSNPILLIPVGMGLAGGVIGLTKGLLFKRRRRGR